MFPRISSDSCCLPFYLLQMNVAIGVHTVTLRGMSLEWINNVERVLELVKGTFLYQIMILTL